MSLRRHHAAVRAAEAAVAGNHANLRARWQALRATGQAAATPARIVVAGLLLGYLGGRALPARRGQPHRGLDLLTQLLRVLAAGLPVFAARRAAPSRGDKPGAPSVAS